MRAIVKVKDSTLIIKDVKNLSEAIYRLERTINIVEESELKWSLHNWRLRLVSKQLGIQSSSLPLPNVKFIVIK
jgi:hypothetical protein